MLTIEDAKKWASERSEMLDSDRLANQDPLLQMMNKAIPEKSKNLWDSSIWLAMMLDEHGATDDQIESIQMAQGQRSLFGDPWEIAVEYANEFIATGSTKEKGGLELARKINKEIFD